MTPELLTIVGPTGVGKSSLAMNLAGVLNGEIINGDSRQIFQRLNIGTAKPSPHDRSQIAHHLVDVIDPTETYGLARFIEDSTRIVTEIHSRGNQPFLVGGTGQYIWGLLEGWRVPRIPPNPHLRTYLEQQAETHGSQKLHKKLTSIAPEVASQIDHRNKRRVIRALEKHTLGQSADTSSRETRVAPSFKTTVIGLTMDRAHLYKRIDTRITNMIASGWIDEVAELMKTGYEIASPSMTSVGYGELISYIQGKTSLKEAIDRIKSRTHRLVRQQYSWFRLDDKRIKWFNVNVGSARMDETITRWLNDNGIRANSDGK